MDTAPEESVDPAALDEGRRAGIVEPAGEAFRRVVTVMARLRAPGGCPWDAEQTHESLQRYLLEETYETLEAIDSGDPASLRDELGDLVLQVLFHADIAWEEGTFTIADVCEHLAAKLVRRHPHVFGDVAVSGADEVLANWERTKRTERGAGVMDGVPRALPALARAAKVRGRAAGAGFDYPDHHAAAAHVREELGEVLAEAERATGRAEHDRVEHDRVEQELGDLLFVTVALAGKLGVEPEDALRKATERFQARFAGMERSAADAGRDLESLSLSEWGEYWERAKRARP